MATIEIVGSGRMRSVEVDGEVLIDGTTGKPAEWPKAVIFGAMFGQRNEFTPVLGVMMGLEELRCVN